MKASDVLDVSANQIEKTGLLKGYMRSDYTAPASECQYCTLGAIFYAPLILNGDEHYVTREEYAATGRAHQLVEVLLDGESVVNWSDRGARTAEQVVDVLRHAKTIALAEEKAA